MTRLEQLETLLTEMEKAKLQERKDLLLEHEKRWKIKMAKPRKEKAKLTRSYRANTREKLLREFWLSFDITEVVNSYFDKYLRTLNPPRRSGSIALAHSSWKDEKMELPKYGKVEKVSIYLSIDDPQCANGYELRLTMQIIRPLTNFPNNRNRERVIKLEKFRTDWNPTLKDPIEIIQGWKDKFFASCP